LRFGGIFVKKSRSPFLWLLLIPGQLLLDAVLVMTGPMLDTAIFSGSQAEGGHGLPIFSLLFLLLAAVATVAAVIVALVKTAAGLRRRKKAARQSEDPWQ